MSTATASPDVRLQLVLNSEGGETEGDSWTGHKARSAIPRGMALSPLKEVNSDGENLSRQKVGKTTGEEK